MIEKVNPSHPDKVADRIAGAVVDLAYQKDERPKIAVEVLIGHGQANLIVESSVKITKTEVEEICQRIIGEKVTVNLVMVAQDEFLAKNQEEEIRCGDNGVFRGVPLTEEQKELSEIARKLYQKFPTDGKFILDGRRLVVCQSQAKTRELADFLRKMGDYELVVNPLGEWTGGIEVDAGATNRKLGSDLADSVTGGGLHGKDLSKADVALTIYAFLQAQKTEKKVELSCAIGDKEVGGRKYAEIVKEAKEFIDKVGGFEKLAEWGLV